MNFFRVEEVINSKSILSCELISKLSSFFRTVSPNLELIVHVILLVSLAKWFFTLKNIVCFCSAVGLSKLCEFFILFQGQVRPWQCSDQMSKLFKEFPSFAFFICECPTFVFFIREDAER